MQEKFNSDEFSQTGSAKGVGVGGYTQYLDSTCVEVACCTSVGIDSVIRNKAIDQLITNNK